MATDFFKYALLNRSEVPRYRVKHVNTSHESFEIHYFGTCIAAILLTLHLFHTAYRQMDSATLRREEGKGRHGRLPISSPWRGLVIQSRPSTSGASYTHHTAYGWLSLVPAPGPSRLGIIPSGTGAQLYHTCDLMSQQLPQQGIQARLLFSSRIILVLNNQK